MLLIRPMYVWFKPLVKQERGNGKEEASYAHFVKRSKLKTWNSATNKVLIKGMTLVTTPSSGQVWLANYPITLVVFHLLMYDLNLHVHTSLNI